MASARACGLAFWEQPVELVFLRLLVETDDEKTERQSSDSSPAAAAAAESAPPAAPASQPARPPWMCELQRAHSKKQASRDKGMPGRASGPSRGGRVWHDPMVRIW